MVGCQLVGEALSVDGVNVAKVLPEKKSHKLKIRLKSAVLGISTEADITRLQSLEESQGSFFRLSGIGRNTCQNP